MATLTEQPPRCMGPSREHHRTVGFQPCHCSAGRTGHRTYWCTDWGLTAPGFTMTRAVIGVGFGHRTQADLAPNPDPGTLSVSSLGGSGSATNTKISAERSSWNTYLTVRL